MSRELIDWVLFLALCIGYVGVTKAEPMAAAEQGGVRIVIYTEPCELKEVSNLSNKATWTENGKTLQGCAGLFGQIGLVVFYFTDKSVVPVPAQLFQRVSNT